MVLPSDRDPRLLAAEYVLGTLSAEACSDIEKELEHNGRLRQEVIFWEQKFGLLGLALPPAEPPADVWETIQQHMHRDAATTEPPTNLVAPQARSVRIWQGLALAASVAVVVLAGLLYVAKQPSQPTPTTAYVSMFFDSTTSTGWFLRANIGADRMRVTTVGDYTLPAGKELRLWVIPKGGKPVASGVLPVEGKRSWSLSARVKKLLQLPSTSLAVSLEESGQSLANGPQGPIMWQAHIHQPG